jgi:tRNA pseudouridine55 synthase
VLRQKDLGHTGTLDPLASGVLVVAVGKATKLIRFLTHDDKRYVADIDLSEGRNTDDREGTTTQTSDLSSVTSAQIEAALQTFRGNILQKPPMHSAVHKDGVRLYELARRGEVVEVEARPVVVYAVELRNYVPPIATVDIHCGKGFFVRSLARELGSVLGVHAHLAGLRRTAVGLYGIEAALPLHTLQADDTAWRAHLIGDRHAYRGMPVRDIDDVVAQRLRHGQRIRVDEPDSPPALAVLAGDVVAVVDVIDGHLRVLRGY